MPKPTNANKVAVIYESNDGFVVIGVFHHVSQAVAWAILKFKDEKYYIAPYYDVKEY